MICPLKSIFFSPVPTGTPQNLQLTVRSSTEISLAWDAVDVELRNGVILGYSIKVEDTSKCDVQMNFTTANYAYNLTALKPHTIYNMTVAAFTSKGTGSESLQMLARTKEEGNTSSHYGNIGLMLVH